MMNIGFRPTVDGLNHIIEINLFDFNQDIYGKKMEVSLVQRIRGEQKFSGLDTLQAQLKKDQQDAMNILS
jgi:riboflavin kinase / FMN adenylyltransferase